ncbi:peptidoglycan DD-metalloendopeptidase family protein [Caldimonas sp. KR1-144]|uniref:peptidoglycan DD-metalloendopeptidase family protein n=1 Tax=Caldimonas sp. KR1-144 TaxID=3400911 RepID=UPI003C0D55B0
MQVFSLLRSIPKHATSRGARAVGVIALAAVLAACASSNRRAPVEDRSTGRAPSATAAAVPAEPASAPPGAENAGKPGYYTVKPGDTMIRIGLETGQNWRDIVRWNNMDNANVIEVGQVLRVLPPGVDANGVATKPVGSTRVDARPLDAPRPTVAASAASAVTATTAPGPTTAAASSPTPAPAASTAAREEEDVTWSWPASGPVLAGFDEARNKGVAIGGKAGDPVLAAADGRVVYAGSGLRGYGNLVIVKHNGTFLTAYAHNQTLLVKEDQPVKRGQKIAEMGSTDAQRVQLHFEIRKQGKPVDPTRLLPPR